MPIDSVQVAERDSVELAERLRRALEPRQVILVLRDLGITNEDLQEVTQTDPRTVRRWQEDDEKASGLRAQARDAVDRLRVLVLYMLQQDAMPPGDIAHWLRSRNLELDMDANLGVRRPLDAIRDDQLPDVFRAINAFLRPKPLSSEAVAHRIERSAEALAERETNRALQEASSNDDHNLTNGAATDQRDRGAENDDPAGAKKDDRDRVPVGAGNG
jgi:hypothetical protein